MAINDLFENNMPFPGFVTITLDGGGERWTFHMGSPVIHFGPDASIVFAITGKPMSSMIYEQRVPPDHKIFLPAEEPDEIARRFNEWQDRATDIDLADVLKK